MINKKLIGGIALAGAAIVFSMQETPEKPLGASQDTINIQVKFKMEENGLKFQDTLNLTQGEYEALSKEEIEEMKQARFDAWKNHVVQQSRREPTTQEITEQIESLRQQLDDLETQRRQIENRK